MARQPHGLPSKEEQEKHRKRGAKASKFARAVGGAYGKDRREPYKPKLPWDNEKGEVDGTTEQHGARVCGGQEEGL